MGRKGFKPHSKKLSSLLLHSYIVPILISDMTILRICDVLENKHSIGIIVCLYMRGEMSKSRLYHSVSTNPRMGEKLNRLVNLGIVETNKVGKRVDVRLTDAGSRMAAALCSMEEEFYGDVGDLSLFAEGDCYLGEDKADCFREWVATGPECRRITEGSDQDNRCDLLYRNPIPCTLEHQLHSQCGQQETEYL